MTKTNKQTHEAANPQIEIINVVETHKPIKLGEDDYSTQVDLYVIDSSGQKRYLTYHIKTFGEVTAIVTALAKVTLNSKLSDELVVFTTDKFVEHLINSRKGKGVHFQRLFNNLYVGRVTQARAVCIDTKFMTNTDETTKETGETK